MSDIRPICYANVTESSLAQLEGGVPYTTWGDSFPVYYKTGMTGIKGKILLLYCLQADFRRRFKHQHLIAIGTLAEDLEPNIGKRPFTGSFDDYNAYSAMMENAVLFKNLDEEPNVEAAMPRNYTSEVLGKIFNTRPTFQAQKDRAGNLTKLLSAIRDETRVVQKNQRLGTYLSCRCICMIEHTLKIPSEGHLRTERILAETIEEMEGRRDDPEQPHQPQRATNKRNRADSGDEASQAAESIVKREEASHPSRSITPDEPMDPRGQTKTLITRLFDTAQLPETEDWLWTILQFLERRQLLLEGPSATYKSTIAMSLARALAQPFAVDDNDQIEIVTHIADVSEFTIHTYVKKGKIVEELGFMNKMIEKAKDNTKKRFIIILEEMDKYVPEMLKYLSKLSGIDGLRIPANMYIIATANMAERFIQGPPTMLLRRFVYKAFTKADSLQIMKQRLFPDHQPRNPQWIAEKLDTAEVYQVEKGRYLEIIERAYAMTENVELGAAIFEKVDAPLVGIAFAFRTLLQNVTPAQIIFHIARADGLSRLISNPLTELLGHVLDHLSHAEGVKLG